MGAFMTRDEKREEFAKCLKKITSFRTPYYEEALKKACILYRELYVLPIYEKIGKQPAAMVMQERGMDSKTVANYYCHDNLVNINFGRVLEATGKDKVDRALEALLAIGHEYRHNLQKEIAQSLYQNEKTERYKNIVGNDAEVIGLSYLHTRAGVLLYGHKKEARTLLQFFPALLMDIKKEVGKKDYEEVVKLCDRALYLECAIEVDARKMEIAIAKECLRDMQEFFRTDKLPIEVMKEAISGFEEYNKDCKVAYVPIVKKIYAFFDQLKPAKFQRFGKELYRMEIKGALVYQEGYGDDSEIKKLSEKKELLKDAIAMYANKNIDYKDLKHKKKMLGVLRNIFVKHGYTAAADVLKDGGFLSDNDYADEYFEILKNENITAQSFDKIKILSSGKVNELLKIYIESGKTAYVEQILQKASSEAITSALVWQTRTYQRKLQSGEVTKKPNDYDYIIENNIYLALQERYIELKNLQKKGNLLYDDVDDYISMLASFCKLLGIDYTQKQQKFTGSEMSQEIRYTMLELYKSAEQLGLDLATLMRGYKPAEEEYRYACPVDRGQYLLNTKQREMRIKNIYGEREYDRVADERFIAEEYLEELEMEE